MNDLRLTLILFLIFLALGGYSFYGHQSPKVSEDRSKKFDHLQKQAIQRVEIVQHQKQQTLLLEKKNNSWKMLKPKHSDVNQQSIQSLLSIFDYGYIEVIENSPKDLPQYGLSNPVVTFSAVMHTKNKSRSFVLKIGGDTPDGTACYGRFPDNPTIYLLGIAYKEKLLQPPSFYL